MNEEPIIQQPELLREVISHPRFETYLNAKNGNEEKAMQLYLWNTAVSAAFYGPLQALEVTLRNAVHSQLAKRYGDDWYDNPQSGLTTDAKKKILNAKQKLDRNCNSPDIIAALSFGFWVSLLGKGKYKDGQGKIIAKNYEMSLWRPALHRAFPHADSLTRRQAHQKVKYLRDFRNRIAHHEPIFKRHLEQDYNSILLVTGWIECFKRDWIDRYSRVRSLLKTPINHSDLRF